MVRSPLPRTASILATVAVLLGVLVGGASSVAAVPPETPGGDACRDVSADVVPEDGRVRVCATVDVVSNGGTVLCRETAGLPAAECATPSGRVVDGALVDAYERSWAHRAHALQRELGDTLPLRLSHNLATHNSYNSAAYRPTLSGSDPNQQYTITDQLRMDIRVIELDVHWFPSADAGGPAPVLCHATGPHLGCSTDRHLREGLVEIADWLAAPVNGDEVLIVRIENHLDDLQGHEVTAALVEDVLGPLVFRPAGGGCTDFPLEVSRDDIRAAGARILLVSDCGQGGAWTSLFHAYGQRVEAGTGDFTPFPACGSRFTREEHDAKFIRRFEDGTWLSTMAADPGPRIDADMAREMLRCGVNQPSFDHLTPDDPRLEATVWSWAPDEPAAGGGACAVHGDDGRLRTADCLDASAADGVACRTADGWAVVAEVTSWGGRACDAVGGAFAVPRSSPENEALIAAKAAAGVAAVWVDYRAAGDDWRPEASDAAPRGIVSVLPPSR